jgi:alpha-L-rhamnosidase
MASQWSAKWIGYAYDPRADLGVFAFRRRFVLDGLPAALRVRLTADNRYKLYVNGQFVDFGPQRGDETHWFFDMLDLSPFLRPGENEIVALVWNFGWMAPMAQRSVRTGFVLEHLEPEEGLNLSTPTDWEVARIESWSFDMIHRGGFGEFYIDVGPGEIVDAAGVRELARALGGPEGQDEGVCTELIWKRPHEICRAEDRGAMGGGTPWMLIPRSLPPMLYAFREQAPIARWDYDGQPPTGAVPEAEPTQEMQQSRDAERLSSDSGLAERRASVALTADPSPLELPVEIAADRPLLLDFEELLCAYPRLTLDGPVGTVVSLTYDESLWQADGLKGNRNEVAGKHLRGYQDKVVLDGAPFTFEPLWWRTFRYLLIEVSVPYSDEATTEGREDEPAKLLQLEVYETGYPLEEKSSFVASDPDVQPIWDVSLRTARRCAGETYFDCPYWEQLQYIGDARIQALIGYYISPDRALQRNAVETLGWSLMENGLTQSRYPSRQVQVIPPFSLWWVMMLYDQMLYDDHRPDFASFQTVSRILGRCRALMKSQGQFWQFADWVPAWRWGVPPGGANHLVHRLTLGWAQWASLSLKQHWEGKDHDPVEPQFWRDWSKYGSGPGGLVVGPGAEESGASEHAEALYRLLALQAGKGDLPTWLSWPRQGLDKAHADRCTYYFSYYKHLAMAAADPNFDYVAELQPWKEMIEDGLTTFAENPEPTRSDCHAWSAHPILGFFQIVAGVTSVSPGWKKARIAPRPGPLRKFEATIAHPQGTLRVQFEDGRLEVDSPVPFSLAWKGREQEFPAGGAKA